MKILFFTLLFIGCGRKEEESSYQEKVEEKIAVHDLSQAAREYSDSMLTILTLEERIGQFLMPSIPSVAGKENIEKLQKWVRDYHIGGIVLLQGNIEGAEQLVRNVAAEKVPLFIAIDAEWGLGMRLEDALVYPKNGLIEKDIEEIKLYDYGYEVAGEAGSIGINMILGPVIDVSNKRVGAIGLRSFGGDAERVSDLGVAYAKGLESGGVMSVAKHFPGHGNTREDSHKGVAVLTGEINKLDSVELKPFRKYVDAGLSGVMAGHIQARGLDPDGVAASVSMDMLTSLLREEMGFKGLILTDAFDMGGAKGFTATEAIKAGADIILCPMDVGKEYNGILENIKDGNLDIGIVNERCRRILFMKYLFTHKREESR